MTCQWVHSLTSPPYTCLAIWEDPTGEAESTLAQTMGGGGALPGLTSSSSSRIPLWSLFTSPSTQEPFLLFLELAMQRMARLSYPPAHGTPSRTELHMVLRIPMTLGCQGGRGRGEGQVSVSPRVILQRGRDRGGNSCQPACPSTSPSDPFCSRAFHHTLFQSSSFGPGTPRRGGTPVSPSLPRCLPAAHLAAPAWTGTPSSCRRRWSRWRSSATGSRRWWRW